MYHIEKKGFTRASTFFFFGWQVVAKWGVKPNDIKWDHKGLKRHYINNISKWVKEKKSWHELHFNFYLAWGGKILVGHQWTHQDSYSVEYGWLQYTQLHIHKDLHMGLCTCNWCRPCWGDIQSWWCTQACIRHQDLQSNLASRNTRPCLLQHGSWCRSRRVLECRGLVVPELYGQTMWLMEGLCMIWKHTFSNKHGNWQSLPIICFSVYNATYWETERENLLSWQREKGSPVMVRGQLHTGLWLTTSQKAFIPQVPGHGSAHFCLMHARYCGQSELRRHSGLHSW